MAKATSASLCRPPLGGKGNVRGDTRVSETQYESARSRFAHFARRSIYQEVFGELVKRSDPFPELAKEAVSNDLEFLTGPGRLAQVLRPVDDGDEGGMSLRGLGRTLRFPTPAEELWRYASSASPEELRALDVLLRRAIDPVEALATWPLEAFFDAEEAASIATAAANHSPVDVGIPQWTAGEDADYKGFVCVIAKFTRLCNLRCTYCSDWRAGPNQTMPFEVQLELFRKLLGEPSHGSVDVVWHGGEPTLLGRRGFLRVLALQRHFRRPGQRVRNMIQTNATRIDESFAQLLARCRFQVGVSLDGPAEINDGARRYANGVGSLDAALRGLEHLRNAGLRPSVLVVVGQRQLALGAEGLVDFLIEAKIPGVGLLPVHPAAGPRQPNQPYLEHRDYARFLLEVDAARRERREPWLRVRELDSAAQAVRGTMPAFCELLGNCVGSYFSIDPDGSIQHCDKYVGDDDYTVGNIRLHSFSDIRASGKLTKLVADAREASERKKSCPYFTYCRGWCPHRDYMAQRYSDDPAAACCGLFALFDALIKETNKNSVEHNVGPTY